jgi:hypothetical protein
MISVNLGLRIVRHSRCGIETYGERHCEVEGFIEHYRLGREK